MRVLHAKHLLVLFLTMVCPAVRADDTIEALGRKWTVPVAADWLTDQKDGVEVLRLLKHRGPLPGPRRPIQFALADRVRKEATVEADVMPLGHSLLIVFAYRDAAHFDYAHLSSDTAESQPVHNGIFHVYGGERVRISSERGPAAFAATGRWYRVKLSWSSNSGRVSVAVDGHPVPALDAVDMSLESGKIGLGSFDETAAFKNVRISE